MKRLSASAMLMLLFLSCSKVREGVHRNEAFSNYPKIEKWVGDNLQDIESNYNLKEFQSLPIAYQQASFRVLSINRKCTIWQEKIKELFHLPLTINEMEHIKHLIVSMSPSWFQGKNSVGFKEMNAFMSKWSEQGKKEFNWSDEDIANMVVSLSTKANENVVIDEQQTYGMPAAYGMGGVSEDEYGGVIKCCYCTPNWPTCPKRGSSYDPDPSRCRNEGCSGTAPGDGCGWFWQFECTGQCYWDDGTPTLPIVTINNLEFL